MKRMEIAMSSNQTNWLAIALTFVLAGVFFVLISGGSEAGYSHTVEMKGDSSLSGDPEETLTYTIEVENIRNVTLDVTLEDLRTDVNGIENPSLRFIPMKDFDTCNKSGEKVTNEIYKLVWQFDRRYTCVFRDY